MNAMACLQGPSNLCILHQFQLFSLIAIRRKSIRTVPTLQEAKKHTFQAKNSSYQALVSATVHYLMADLVLSVDLVLTADIASLPFLATALLQTVDLSSTLTKTQIQTMSASLVIVGTNLQSQILHTN